jgi:CRP-like cAMP-binding protein
MSATPSGQAFPGTHVVRMTDLLSTPQLTSLLAEAGTAYFNRHDTIVPRGRVSSFLYFIEEGRVISKQVSRDGGEFLVRFYGEGEFVSWLFAYRRVPSVFEYQAQTSVCLRTISLDTFEAMLADDPPMALALNRILIERLEAAYSIIHEYTTQGGLPRLAHLIGRLGRKYGAGANQTLLRGFTQQDIANFAGLSRARVSEGLAALQKAGLVSLHRSEIEVLDVRALLAFEEPLPQCDPTY